MDEGRSSDEGTLEGSVSSVFGLLLGSPDKREGEKDTGRDVSTGTNVLRRDRCYELRREEGRNRRSCGVDVLTSSEGWSERRR